MERRVGRRACRTTASRRSRPTRPQPASDLVLVQRQRQHERQRCLGRR